MASTSAPVKSGTSRKPKANYVSLRTKLYLLICFIVVASIGTITVRNIVQSKGMLEAQMSQRSLNMSEMSLKSLEGQFNIWRTQAAQILRFLDNKKSAQGVFFAKGILDTSKNLVSIQVMSTGSKTKRKRTPSLHLVKDQTVQKNKKIKSIIANFNKQWIQKNVDPKRLDGSYLAPFKKLRGAKYYTLLMPATTDGDQIIWVIFTITIENLTQYIANERGTYAFVLDERGKYLLSGKKIFGQLNIFRTATSGNIAVGSKSFTTRNGVEHLAAFAWSHRFKFAVVYIKDITETIQSIKIELIKTGVLTFIILVLALLLGYFAAVSLTVKLGKLTGLTRTIAQGDFSQRIHLKSNDEIGFLENSINHMAGEIHRLLNFSVEAAKKEKELLTAKAVQDTFFSKDSIRSGNVFTVGTYVSADECGGDWWGHFVLNDDVDIVCIADATGHGAPAALVTAIAYSFFQTFFQIIHGMDTPNADPGQLLGKLNKVFWEAGRGKTTMTFFLGFVNKKTATLTYANAGHNFPMIFPKAGDDSRLKKRKAGSLHSKYFQLSGKGIPLGYQDDSSFDTKTVSLEQGDKLFLYTDGLIECKNRSGEMWGKTKMIKALNNLITQDIEFVLKEVVRLGFEFFDSEPTEDDITVVMIEYN